MKQYFMQWMLVAGLGSCVGGDGCNRSPSAPSPLSRVPGNVRFSPQVKQPGLVAQPQKGPLMPQMSDDPADAEQAVPHAAEPEGP